MGAPDQTALNRAEADEFLKRLGTAIVRDIVIWAMVEYLPPLRRLKPWYRRGSRAAIVVGAVVGVVGSVKQSRDDRSRHANASPLSSSDPA